ncbi:MltA domain-containing protein [uncultured Methylibium sp.]|uniref:murein transglycosylase A n=1 Tax=uncultured Methylibium sp. TaxID=381093 RepID=UPI0025D38315|nr:MltA domain-containing protein [uncultured Methylibium sp.]
MRIFVKRRAWLAMVGALVGCTTPGTVPPPAAPSTAGTTAPTPAPTGTPIERENARWQPAAWADLPGWESDTPIHAWPALLQSCSKPAPGWAATCASAKALADPTDTRVRAWLQRTLQPYRVTARDGEASGLITGYFEPLVAASRTRSKTHGVPLHAPPAALAARKPWYTRAEIDTLPAARAALQGREIAWVADPLDALLLQVQGSGRLVVSESDGRSRTVRLAYAGHNDQPYQSVGRWLVERGAFTLEQASWPAIKAWARANPGRVTEMLNANPRYVFFREEPLADPAVGAVGAQGVPLTPGRSIAVDPRAVPYGTPVWLDTTEPLLPAANTARAAGGAPPAARPLQRLVLAQDTGSAITGAVRADYFWGWTEGAEDYAGRMKQPLKMWVLWPRP